MYAKTQAESRFAVAATPSWLASGIPWLWKGMLAFAEAGLISGSNFFTGILLARWLSAEQYGAYAFSFSIFLLCASLYQALLLEPMSVLGPSTYFGREREYLGALLWLHGFIGLTITIVLGATALLLRIMTAHGDVVEAMAGLAVASPFILLLWIARGACYLKLTPGPAASGAALYSLLLLGALGIMLPFGRIGSASVFLLMGFAASVVGAILLVRLKPVMRPHKRTLLLGEVWRRHWIYGRWALGSAVVTWAPENIFYAIIGALSNVGAVGGFRALMNLALPVTHSASSLSRLAQPHLARVAGQSGPTATIRPVRRILVLYISGALAYGILVTVFRRHAFVLLYGGQFGEWANLTFLVAPIVLLQVGAYAPHLGLRAIQSPSLVFAAYAASTAVSVILGVPLTWKWGLTGALIAFAISCLVAFIFAIVIYRWKVTGVNNETLMPDGVKTDNVRGVTC